MSQEARAKHLLDLMFETEMSYIRSGADDMTSLARAFHPDVVVHEPRSLPYPGDWTGLNGVGALFRRMRAVWSDIGVERLEAGREGDTVYMTCLLRLTSRVTAKTIVQPFSETLRFKGDLLVDGTPFYFDTAEIVGILS